eukprot:gnl/TRDRNA2_/TRDRNA2_87156_c0_seq1.p1 gnl/TRDRNA2_/TRDRNA2_87156_c0~~gnl/TRDRNA2_/TRDRNA2_87156_c0_seq1.p1  ORF type:complete len:419 (-),score=51.30 gnl/TRDRNA2_/TRDRNA2_87156_c0_seq1:88-1344(-)
MCDQGCALDNVNAKPFMMDKSMAEAFREVPNENLPLPSSPTLGYPLPTSAERKVPQQAREAAVRAAQTSQQPRPEEDRHCTALPDSEEIPWLDPEEFYEPFSVVLSVYDATHWPVVNSINSFVLSAFGAGAYHVGVDVHRQEWSYGRALTGSGLSYVMPRKHPSHRFRGAIKLGTTNLSRPEVLMVLSDMAKTWVASEYHIFNRNCCHFAAQLAVNLGAKSCPPWIDRLCRLGSSIVRPLDSAIGAANNVLLNCSRAVPTGPWDSCCGGACHPGMREKVKRVYAYGDAEVPEPPRPSRLLSGIGMDHGDGSTAMPHAASARRHGASDSRGASCSCGHPTPERVQKPWAANSEGPEDDVVLQNICSFDPVIAIPQQPMKETPKSTHVIKAKGDDGYEIETQSANGSVPPIQVANVLGMV